MSQSNHHLQTVAASYYYSGISDILTLDETIKRNPQALVRHASAFKAGMRGFTANVSGNDLVRRYPVYMVRLSDLEKYRAEGSRCQHHGWAKKPRNTRILESPAARDKP